MNPAGFFMIKFFYSNFFKAPHKGKVFYKRKKKAVDLPKNSTLPCMIFTNNFSLCWSLIWHLLMIVDPFEKNFKSSFVQSCFGSNPDFVFRLYKEFESEVSFYRTGVLCWIGSLVHLPRGHECNALTLLKSFC